MLHICIHFWSISQATQKQIIQLLCLKIITYKLNCVFLSTKEYKKINLDYSNVVLNIFKSSKDVVPP